MPPMQAPIGLYEFYKQSVNNIYHYGEIGNSTAHSLVTTLTQNAFNSGTNFYINYNVNASNVGTNRSIGIVWVF